MQDIRPSSYLSILPRSPSKVKLIFLMMGISVLDLQGNKGDPNRSSSAKATFAPPHCGILTVMAETPKRRDTFRPAGFFLLVTGWLLALSAVMMLKQPGARGAFVATAIAVEAAGLVLVARSFIAPKPERR